MKQLPTILILFWGIWLNSCNGIHDQGYKDHEWNGGAGGGVRVLRFGESFAFESFPPKSAVARQSSLAGHGYRRGYLPSVESTWEFRSSGDCVLKFSTLGFERGDVDCEQQYFIIGDEDAESRFCGFTRPPKYFLSSGKRLFLTHYQRNGDRRIISSYLRGRVSCTEAPVYYDGYENSTGQGGDTLRCPSDPFNCTTYVRGGFSFDGNTAVINGTFGGNPFNVNKTCHNDESGAHSGCGLDISACFVVQNSSTSTSDYYSEDNPRTPGNQTCQAQPPMDPSCLSITVPCQTQGECTGDEFHYDGHFQSGSGQTPCNAEPDELCSEVISLCLRSNAVNCPANSISNDIC